MVKTEKVLLAKRTTDGLYLRLDEQRHTTGYDFVSDPVMAKKVSPCNDADLSSPHEAPYYFENSYRARELWVKYCVMVPFEITTKVIAKAIQRIDQRKRDYNR